MISEEVDHPVNRKGWPAGPWDSEPDKLEWRDAATGLPCLIVRNRVGGLCGYVGVSPEHPYHGIEYSGCTHRPPCGETYCGHSPAVEVHGGLTYSAECQGSICHVPAPGESENVWWFGFDCVHFGDLAPSEVNDPISRTLGLHNGDIYRDVPYVRAEVASLAAQLAAVK